MKPYNELEKSQILIWFTLWKNEKFYSNCDSVLSLVKIDSLFSFLLSSLPFPDTDTDQRSERKQNFLDLWHFDRERQPYPRSGGSELLPPPAGFLFPPKIFVKRFQTPGLLDFSWFHGFLLLNNYLNIFSLGT